ncbi:adenylosuccinate synthase [Brucepastera parasyntrophica]|uniref:adenylosuccinate synthase n=1 Tax=Brucepastera parasyntrophica TaxID=2880008 RepID=UPI002109B9DB|nr:adenylosuccinate synthase [Brucepastera parasyntrophica]ULQ59391.1 adenylosuccinate synthase [Brucepastera parasyntrophica]
MNVVVIGAQWGDEGKGKVVDYLGNESQYIVRFSGGANAGHTIVNNGVQYALHLVPSGILHPNNTVYLGAAMVIDPEALFNELAMLKEHNINWEGRVFISDRAHLVLPRYRELDIQRDSMRKRPIGTTGRGIGITYALKSERDSIRLADLTWKEKMDDLEDADRAFLEPYLDRLLSMKVNLTTELWNARGKKILFEGAQGALLDLDLGTYPYVSSGFSSAAGAAIGGCIGPRAIDKVLGVFKAYSTRVGNGPMPTEFNADSQSELYNFVRDTGREYGVTTGRPRRCGYLDLVALRYACRSNSIDTLALTHLDVYDTLDTVEACIAYNIDGTIVEEFPASIEDLNKATPILKTFKGWNTSLKECRSYDDLPAEAREYVDFIELYTGTRIGIISVGFDRNDTFVRENIWK